MPFSSLLVIFLFPSQPFADIGFEVESPEPTTSNSKSRNLISTPMKTSQTGGASDSLTDIRGRDLLSHCEAHSRVWRESNNCSAMIDHVAGLASVPKNTISTIMKSNEYIHFLDSVDQKQANERQFHMLAARITRELPKKPHPSVIYVAAGQWPLFSWHQVDDKKQSPKIDFFTTRIKRDVETNVVHSECFDGVSRPVSQKLRQLLANTSGDYLVDNSTRDFAMENIGTIIELKSKTSMINDTRLLENLNLKATEILRCQFHRRFILGFLVAGSKMRVVLFSREGVFVGAPANFMDNTLLVRCIAATLFASNIELGLPPEGLFTYLSDNQDSCITLKSAHTCKTLHFEILERTLRPSRDILLGRGTTILKVKDQNSSNVYALKTSSPYSIRPHEGSILRKLHNISDVAYIAAYTEWPRDGLPNIFHTVDWNQPGEFHERSFRITVTEWIPDGFATTNITFIETLDAWGKVYKAVANLAKAGYLHRDLSFENVRLQRTSSNEIVVKLVDFDLVDQIENLDSATAAPDRTGTVLFMPIEILYSTPPPPRQEQHEDETAFWLGLLALFKHYFKGPLMQSILSDRTWSIDTPTFSQIKSFIIKDLCWTGNCAYFSEPVPEFRDYVLFLREVCTKLVKEQFEGFPEFQYPSLEIRRDGQREQAINHQRINPSVCRILEDAVKVLRAKTSIPNLVDSFKRL